MKKVTYESTVKISISELASEEDIEKYCKKRNIKNFGKGIKERFDRDTVEIFTNEFSNNDESHKSSITIENSSVKCENLEE